MKKWIALLLAAMLTAGSFAGCQQSFKPTYPEGVTKEKLEEISAEYDAGMSWYHIDGYGSYYLGHENGYDIIYHFWIPSVRADFVEDVEMDILEMYTYKIGSASFYPCTRERLLVYMNGSFRFLEDCYSEGLISEETVLLAEEQLDEYVEILKDIDPDVYWQRERKYKRSAYDLDWATPEFVEYLNGSQSREYPILQEWLQAASED